MTLKNILTILGVAAVTTAPYWIAALGPYAPAVTALLSVLGGIYHLNQSKP